MDISSLSEHFPSADRPFGPTIISLPLMANFSAASPVSLKVRGLPLPPETDMVATTVPAAAEQTISGLGGFTATFNSDSAANTGEASKTLVRASLPNMAHAPFPTIKEIPPRG